MTDSVAIALISAVPPTLVTILTWLSSRRKIEQIHVSINSRVDELLKAAKGEAAATGHAAGMKEQKDNP